MSLMTCVWLLRLAGMASLSGDGSVFRRTARLGIRDDPRQGRLVGGLRQVRIESCARRLVPVLFLAEASQRHKQDPIAQNPTNLMTRLVPVQPSHVDIEEDHLR